MSCPDCDGIGGHDCNPACGAISPTLGRAACTEPRGHSGKHHAVYPGSPGRSDEHVWWSQ